MFPKDIDGWFFISFSPFVVTKVCTIFELVYDTQLCSASEVSLLRWRWHTQETFGCNKFVLSCILPCSGRPSKSSRMYLALTKKQNSSLSSILSAVSQFSGTLSNYIRLVPGSHSLNCKHIYLQAHVIVNERIVTL